MSSNYEMCKFLAGERIARQRQIAKEHRLARSADGLGRSPPKEHSALAIVLTWWQGLVKGRAKKKGSQSDADGAKLDPART